MREGVRRGEQRRRRYDKLEFRSIIMKIRFPITALPFSSSSSYAPLYLLLCSSSNDVRLNWSFLSDHIIVVVVRKWNWLLRLSQGRGRRRRVLWQRHEIDCMGGKEGRRTPSGAAGCGREREEGGGRRSRRRLQAIPEGLGWPPDQPHGQLRCLPCHECPATDREGEGWCERASEREEAERDPSD